MKPKLYGHPFLVRLTDQMAHAVKRAARRRKIPRAEFVRQAIDKALPAIEIPEDSEAA